MKHEVHFDPSLYPRTYSLSPYNQWSYILPGFLLAVVLPVQFWRSHGLNSQPTVLFALLFVLTGGYCVLRGLRQKLVLEPEAITVRYAFVLLTFALSVEPRLPSSWVTENGPKDTSPFALVLILIGGITPTIQAWRYRKILSGAVEAKNTTIQ